MRLLQHILIAGCALAAGVVGAEAQEHIGSTALARNDVTRELAGASAPLVTGDSVFRNETVRTGADSNAKLVFLNSTNLGVGPISSVKLDQFVYVGESNGQKMTVNLAKGVFRFTTGALDKKAYEITHADRRHRRPRHRARHRRAGPRHPGDAGRGPGARLSAPARRQLRAAGAQLHAGRGRGRRTALRLRRPEERRPDRAGQEDRAARA